MLSGHHFDALYLESTFTVVREVKQERVLFAFVQYYCGMYITKASKCPLPLSLGSRPEHFCLL